MRSVRTIRRVGGNHRDRRVPISERYEKPIYTGKDSITVKPYMGKNTSMAPSTELRKKLVGEYLIELETKGIDVRQLLGEAIYVTTYMYVIENRSISEISKILSVSTTTISNKIYGKKHSAYSKLKYWVGRL